MGPPDWHALSAAEACRRLDAAPHHGLEEDEAARRLAGFGRNRLPSAPPLPAWRALAGQFANLLSLMLLAAGGLAAVIGDLTDAAVLVSVTVFNALLGFWQERKAGRVLAALARMVAQSAQVRRGGHRREVPAENLVPGDVVLLGAGDRVPADGRLVAGHVLEIDESALTGESLPVAKAPDSLPAATPLAERANLAFMNTVVAAGRGEMVVTATGPATEMGRLAGLIAAQPDAPTLLQVRLDRLGRRIAAIAVAVVGVVAALGFARGEPWHEVVLTAVALAVAAIPEGLPAVVAVTLAVGMARMARRGAILRRMAAVETLGATTVICADKTGTLTENRMAVRRVWTLAGAVEAGSGPWPPSLAPLLRPAVLCTESRLAADGTVVGDATEAALLRLAAAAGAAPPPWPRVAELPFDPVRKAMATLHRSEDGPVTMVKGAPERVLEWCRAVRGPEGDLALDADLADTVRHEIRAMAGVGLRVLALAEGRGADPQQRETWLDRLTLTALVGLADPPRDSAAPTIATCRGAGIAVKMVTGDHAVTAAAIAAAIGLEGGVLTGAEIAAMDDAALACRVGDVAVFARVAPEHKVRIVAALQACGHVAAMTGDGVNDAAALKRADIGVAMGRTGSDVAREAACMVLTDDDVATIAHAVAEGRTILDNIVKFVRFQLSTNVGALLAVLAAPVLGLPVPFLPIHLLWVNIIMDGPPAMALAFDPPRAGMMTSPPRSRDAPILGHRLLLRLLAHGTVIAAGTLLVFHHALAELPLAEARTLAFTTFVLFQLVNVFNARTGTESIFGRRLFANPVLWLALAAALALQVAAVAWPPAQAVFRTGSLSAGHWLLAAAVAASVVVLDETGKLAWRLGTGRHPRPPRPPRGRI